MTLLDICMVCWADGNRKVKAVQGRVLCQGCIDMALASKRLQSVATPKAHTHLRLIRGGKS